MTDPIIDAHHHYWDLAMRAHPWLVREPMIPFRYGDYSVLRCNFLPDDYRRVSADHRLGLLTGTDRDTRCSLAAATRIL